MAAAMAQQPPNLQALVAAQVGGQVPFLASWTHILYYPPCSIWSRSYTVFFRALSVGHGDAATRDGPHEPSRTDAAAQQAG
jgi:hypothetical protein